MLKNLFKRSLSAHRLVIQHYGDPLNTLKLEKCHGKQQDLSEKSVLLNLVGAPVNHADINFVQGVYPVEDISFPSAVGFEGVFKVDGVGNQVTSFKVDDMVYISHESLGSWSERLLVNENRLSLVPNVFTSSVDAATFKINPFTAYRVLEDFVSLQEGDVFVQNGAASHVGQAAIQMCRERNIITVNIVKNSTYEDKVKRDLASIGANFVITEQEARSKSYSEIVGAQTPKAKLALNMVGDKSVYNLAKFSDYGATIVTIGGVSKRPPVVPTSSLIFYNQKYVGFWLRAWLKDHPHCGKFAKMEKEIFDFYREGKLIGPLYTHPLKLSDYQTVFTQIDENSPSKRYVFLNSDDI